MNRRIVNFVVVIVLTLIAAGLVSAAKNTGPIKNKHFFDFPLVIGDWTGREIPMSDYVYKGIETPYLFLRDYSSPRYQNPVNLSIVWFDDTNVAFHAPEACLGGVSNEVKEEGTLSVKLDREYEIRKFITNLGSIDYLVIYFFDVDGFITTSQSDIRMQVLSKRLLFRRASASFIRLMAPVRANEQETLIPLLDFLRVMYPLVPEYMYTKAAMRTR
ncbi:MAG: exosortase C-terminal domain/associated protein EpsI [Desulfomonilia bacterium]|jgi:EpsI family protein